MYDRAPRHVSSDIVGSTPQSVGPGSYNHCQRNEKYVKHSGYAPFSSMAGRSTLFDVREEVRHLPGPGQYNPNTVASHVKNCRALANRTTRFNDRNPTERNPGPGTYELTKTWGLNKETEEDESKVLDKGPTKTRVRYSVFLDPPSVPSPGQAFGYEESEKTGVLQKQTQKIRDKTMGPAFYCPDHEETKTTKQYKGVHFGQQTAKRSPDFVKAKEGPAPADYQRTEPWRKHHTAWHVDPEGAGTIGEARLPRYHEIVANDEKKKAVPGPGKYDIKGQFSQPNIETLGKAAALADAMDRPPFYSSACRFMSDSSGTPAPGEYNDPRGSFNSHRCAPCIFQSKMCPFGQSARRFKKEMQTTPGPGSYEMNAYSMSQNSTRAAIVSSTQSGGFGTTSKREVFPEKRIPKNPGPPEYKTEKDILTPGKKKAARSAFVSLTNRLAKPAPDTIQRNPPPGSYDVAHSFMETQDKAHYRQPRSTRAIQRRAFLSSRTCRGAELFTSLGSAMHGADLEVPGPATYDQKLSPTAQKLALMVCRDTRFKPIKSWVPGPGNYSLSRMLQNTVLKGTFNVTLNQPVENAVEVQNKTAVRSGLNLVTLKK